jgi:hypothetical protein
MPTTTLIDPKQLSSLLKTHDPKEPIYMLNLLRYKPTATYSSFHSTLAGEPCTGREAYLQRYRAAIGPLMPPGAAAIFIGAAITELVAPDGENWDDVAIVRYETLEGFRGMVESEAYRETAAPHRLAALEDWRLVAMDMVGP